MNFIFKNILSKKEIDDVRADVINNKTLCYSDKVSGNDKIYEVKRIDHHNIVKLKVLTSKLFNEILLNKIYEIFGKFYLLNRTELTINGFSPETHRDGQGMGWNRQSIKDSEHTFRVILYANLSYEEHQIKFGYFNSKPIDFFKADFLYKSINYIVADKIKKLFLKKSPSEVGDFLVFDFNTWHSANSNFNETLGDFQKIYMSFDFATSIEVAERVAKYFKARFNNLSTSLNDYANTDVKFLLTNNQKFEVVNL
jgi:hypothetical protein